MLRGISRLRDNSLRAIGRSKACPMKARVATSAPMISLRTSYRFDNCQCAGRTKDSDEQQVALHRRKTTTKRSQRRERDQLSQGRVHPRQFHLALILKAPRPADLETGEAWASGDFIASKMGSPLVGHPKRRTIATGTFVI